MISTRVFCRRIRIEEGADRILWRTHHRNEVIQTFLFWACLCGVLLALASGRGVLQAIVVVCCVVGFADGLWRSITIGAVMGSSSLLIQNYWRTSRVERHSISRVGQGLLAMGFIPLRVIVVEAGGKLLKIQASPGPDAEFTSALELVRRYGQNQEP